jgi:hypothetical protein
LKLLHVIFAIFYFICLEAKVNAQSLIDGELKRNRLQYSNNSWHAYSADFGKVYFQQGSDSLCRFIIEQFEFTVKHLELKTGLRLKQPLNIIIYPSTINYYETNIGLSSLGQTYTYPTITFEQKPRVVLAFNGSYHQLRLDLEKAVLLQIWNKEIDALTVHHNTVPVPELLWLKLGFIPYQTEGFLLSENDQLYEVISRVSDYNSFCYLFKDPHSDTSVLLAKGFCWFLDNFYDYSRTKQFITALKQKKDIQTAIRLATKKDWEQNLQLYFYFLQHIFGLDSNEKPPLESRSNVIPADILGWMVLNDHNYSYAVQTQVKKKTVLLKYKNKIKQLQSFGTPEWLNSKVDNYPIVHHYENEIVIIKPEKGSLYAFIYNKVGKLQRKIPLPQTIKGLNSFAIYDEKTWVMAAQTAQKSDLIIFNPKTYKIKPLTDDLADDISLNRDKNGQFSFHSGFPANLSKKYKGKSLKAKEYAAYVIQRNSIGELESSQSPPTEPKKEYIGHNSTLVQPPMPGAHQLYWIQQNRKSLAIQDSLIKRINQTAKDTSKSFLQGILKTSKGKDTSNNTTSYNEKLITKYQLSLSKLWMNPSINNDNFINRLQPYQTQFGIYKSPEIGALLQGGYSDIFENYEFNIGYKIPTNNLGSDFFFRYKNRKRLIDWWILYFRKVENLQVDAKANWRDAAGRPYPLLAKIKTNFLQIGATLPISYFAGFEIASALRPDKTVFLSSDRYGLNYPNINTLSNINTVKFTFSSIQPSSKNPNMLIGSRFQTLIDAIPLLGNKNKFTFGVVQDFVHYSSLNNWINFKNHISLGYSGGGNYIRYIFGGQDNSVIIRVDSTKVPEQSSPYIYQQLVNPLRGFEQNTMQGNLFGLYNSELFFQIFNNGLLEAKTKFNFLNRLQVGVFADVAITKETFIKNIPSQSRNSFGLSAKTVLANYPLRIDLAFPYRLSNKPMVHFSLTR